MALLDDIFYDPLSGLPMRGQKPLPPDRLQRFEPTFPGNVPLPQPRPQSAPMAPFPPVQGFDTPDASPVQGFGDAPPLPVPAPPLPPPISVASPPGMLDAPPPPVRSAGPSYPRIPYEGADLPPSSKPASGKVDLPDSVADTSLMGRLGTAFNKIGDTVNNRSSTLLALGAGLMGSQNLGQGLSRGFAAAIPAQQQDIKYQQQNASLPIIRDRLMKTQGLSADEATKMAMAAVGNPALMQQLLPGLFGPKEWDIHDVKDMFGGSKPMLVNRVTGEMKEPTIAGQTGSTAGAGGPQAMGNFDISKVDASKKGWDYAAQYPQEVQAATHAYMDGDVMPTGNPRNNSVGSMAKMVAQKVAMDLGQPQLADDTLYQERRKMRVDLGASGNSSMGGILANGKSAFDHLGTLSDKFVNLGNRSGPDIPGGAHAGSIANWMGNVVAPTPETQAKIKGANDNLMRYGQESTKFYAGSGGGEAERLSAVKNLNTETSTGKDQGSFLETEKELMLARLRQKEGQIRDTLGQQFLDKHPVMTPELQKTIDKIDGNIARLRGGGTPSAPAAASPVIKSKSDYDKLPSGATFTGEDGKPYRKP